MESRHQLPYNTLDDSEYKLKREDLMWSHSFHPRPDQVDAGGSTSHRQRICKFDTHIQLPNAEGSCVSSLLLRPHSGSRSSTMTSFLDTWIVGTSKVLVDTFETTSLSQPRVSALKS